MSPTHATAGSESAAAPAPPATIPLSDAQQRRAVLAWASYDWANSAFSTTVMAGFFPVFFKQFYSAGADVGVSTLRLGVSNSLASILLALAGPILGAVADRGGRRKRFLAAFALAGILGTAGLALVARGQWPLATALFVLGNLGFLGANIFYDGLLVDVAPEPLRDRVSALGYSLGYLGGGLLFAVQVATVIRPQWFGLANPEQAVRLSFATVAVWWLVFSLPLLWLVHEKTSHSGRRRPVGAFGELAGTLRLLRKLRMVALFLVAYWLYIDAVDTVIRMSVDYGLAIGLESKHLLGALLLTQFIGFPAAVAFGRLGEKAGAKRVVLLGIAVYGGVTVGAAWMRTATVFFCLATVIGLVQGGVQSLSRSLYSRLIPANQASEFFGLFNLLGKAGAILGPVLMGLVSHLTGRPRLSILVLLAFLAGGAVLLARLDEDKAARQIADLRRAS